jgi:hypothetical protein
LSIPEQIRSLEDLAAIDAELKILDDQLTRNEARSTLKASLKQLEDKLKNDPPASGRPRRRATSSSPTCAR